MNTTCTASPASPLPSPLELAARPLLLLVQKISGVESTFLTSVNWEVGSQTILIEHNAGALAVVEGLVLDWHDSMCRSLRVSGVAQTSSVGTEVTATQALYRSKEAGGNTSRMHLCDGSAAEEPRACAPSMRAHRSALI